MAFIKASHLQSNIASLDRLPPAAAAEIKARAADAIAQCRAMTRSHWAPMAIDIEIVETVCDVVGESGLRRLSSEGIRLSAEGPLLGPIKNAALRILKARPDAVLRFARQGWAAVYKDVGTAEWVGDDDGGGGRLIASQLPPVVLASRAWPIACAGAIDGAYHTVGATGSVVGDVVEVKVGGEVREWTISFIA
jgi:hypothetical protein